MNRSPRLVVELENLTTLVEFKNRGQQRLAMEFPNQSPDVGRGIRESQRSVVESTNRG
jgi:hypothetical protein